MGENLREHAKHPENIRKNIWKTWEKWRTLGKKNWNTLGKTLNGTS